MNAQSQLCLNLLSILDANAIESFSLYRCIIINTVYYRQRATESDKKKNKNGTFK